jgi:hypothetical protein
MNHKNFKEKDMYLPIKNYLEKNEFKVKSEVGHCDIVAMKDENILIVEMKKSLNLELILQGIERQKLWDCVYLAVPKNYRIMKSKKWKNTCNLLKRLELGLFLITMKQDFFLVEEFIKPEPYKKNKRGIEKKKNAFLKEFNSRKYDYNTGGSNRTKLVTAYREMAIHIGVVLKHKGPLKIKEIKLAGTDQEKTSHILQDNYYGWFNRIERGIYEINETGKKELMNYPELVSYFSQNMK